MISLERFISSRRDESGMTGTIFNLSAVRLKHVCRSHFLVYLRFATLTFACKPSVAIVHKTRVRNHRRVTSSPSAKFKFIFLLQVFQFEAISVKNPAFAGEGAAMIVVHCWTLL